METAFLEFYSQIALVQNNGGNIKHVIKKGKAFETILQITDQVDIFSLVDIYHTELTRVKFFLKECKDPQCRSLYDKIFTKTLNFDNKHVPKHITLLFESFIKGITYFRNQMPQNKAIPIYHRLFSCGDGTVVYRNDNIICLEGISGEEKERRKELAKRCYIERLIYDDLYKKETLHFPSRGDENSRQDDGHLFRIDITKKDFESCFPKNKIHVEVEYTDNFPCKLIIHHDTKNKIIKEIYTKTFSFNHNQVKIYDESVDCKKEIHYKQSHKIETFSKTQFFNLAEHKWSTSLGP